MSELTEAWILGLKDTSFYTRTYTPPGSPTGALVFIPDLTGHVGCYEYVHRRWADRGFVVFTFDQRGFGRTALDPKKARSTVYGRTSDVDQISDVEWALRATHEANPELPLFLMGGSVVLSFATGLNPMDSDMPVFGIIASSPCLRLTKPRRITRRLGGFARGIFPNLNIPTSVKNKYLSHDPDVVKDNESDKLIRHKASLRALDDLLKRGENLLINDYKNWPSALPLLVLHGTEDMLSSVEATKEFAKKLPAKDKRISLYEGGYHDLQTEPDGVKERFTDECIAWAEEHCNPPVEKTT